MKAKYKKSGRKVVLELSLTEARYVHSALLECDPRPNDLFGLAYHDPVREALGELFEANDISRIGGLATFTGKV